MALLLPFVQAELRQLNFTGPAFPVAVPNGAPGRAQVIFTFTIAQRDHVAVLLSGGFLTFDNASVSIESAAASVTPTQGQTTAYPLQFLTVQGANIRGFFSLLLSGVELTQGDAVAVSIVVRNDDAVNARNVTEGFCSIRGRVFTLVSEIAVGQLLNQRQDLNLDPRLRGRG